MVPRQIRSFTRFAVAQNGHQLNRKFSTSYERLLLSLKNHDLKAIKLTMAEDIKTLVDQSSHYGVLSTNSVQFPGFPTGSIVGFELDDSSRPFFVFSSMSAHTRDIRANGKISLTITSKDFKGAADGRVVLIGEIKPLDSNATERREQLRAKYLSRHKDAQWIDFGYD
jgi:hypothetical protein